MSESGLTKEGAREALEYLHNENANLQSQLEASQIREQVLREALKNLPTQIAEFCFGSATIEGRVDMASAFMAVKSCLSSKDGLKIEALTQSQSTDEWIRKSDLIPLDGKYFIADVVGYESKTASRVGEEYENYLDTFKLYRIKDEK